MANASLIRTALLIALITAFGFAATGRSSAADPLSGLSETRVAPIKVVGSGVNSGGSGQRGGRDGS